MNECESEKDLGVVIEKSLKVSRQCLEARNTANRKINIYNVGVYS